LNWINEYSNIPFFFDCIACIPISVRTHLHQNYWQTWWRILSSCSWIYNRQC
jgi:hypothetical protein